MKKERGMAYEGEIIGKADLREMQGD